MLIHPWRCQLTMRRGTGRSGVALSVQKVAPGPYRFFYYLTQARAEICAGTAHGFTFCCACAALARRRTRTKRRSTHAEKPCSALTARSEISGDRDRQRCERQCGESDSWLFDWRRRLLTLVVITAGWMGGAREYNGDLIEEGGTNLGFNWYGIQRVKPTV